MAFRAIGDLAVEVLVKAELAARGHTNGAHKLGGGTPMHGSSADVPPYPAQAGRGAASGKEIGVAERDGEIPPSLFSQFYEVSKEPSPTPKGRPVLTLLRNAKCIGRASPTRRPNVARPIHLVLVVDNHASTDFLRETL